MLILWIMSGTRRWHFQTEITSDYKVSTSGFVKRLKRNSDGERGVKNGIRFVYSIFPLCLQKKSNTYVININTFIVEFTFCPRGWKELQIGLSLEECHYVNVDQVLHVIILFS